MSMSGGGGGRPRYLGAQLEQLARQMDQLERIGRSPAMQRQLQQNTAAAQQYARSWAQVEQQFLAANNASLVHHRRMQQVDAVMGRTGRTAGGVTGIFRTFGGVVSTVSGALGLGGGGLAATLGVAAVAMEKMSRQTITMANTAKDLNISKGGLGDVIQTFRRMGFTFEQAKDQAIELGAALLDISEREFGADLAKKLEPFGEFGDDVVRRMVQIKNAGGGAQEMIEEFARMIERLPTRTQRQISSQTGINTALRDYTKFQKENIAVTEANEAAARRYNRAFVDFTTAADNFTTQVGPQTFQAFEKLRDAIKTGDVDKWKELFTLKFDQKDFENSIFGQIVKWAQGGETRQVKVEIVPTGESKSFWSELMRMWVGEREGGEKGGGLSGKPLRFMGGGDDGDTLPFPYNQMRRSTNIQDRRGVGVPESWGGPNAIVFGEQLRIGRESSQTLIEIRNILQKWDAGEEGGDGGGGGADAGAGRPTFRPGIGPGPRARVRAARGGGGEIDPISGRPTRDHSGAGGSGGGGGRASRHPKAQSDRAMIVMDELIKGGYTPAQAAAVAGSATEESQIGALQNPRERAAGLIHWTPVGGRRNRMDTYLRSQGIESGDYSSEASLRAQARYFQTEARTTEAATSRRFLGAGNDVAEATNALKSNIRYAGPLQPQRVAHARGHLAEWQRRQAAGETRSPADTTRARPLGMGIENFPSAGSLPNSVLGKPEPQEGFRGVRDPATGRFGADGPQSSLDGARQRALIDGMGTGKWEGKAALDINVIGPAQVDASRSKGFEKIEIGKSRTMARTTAESGRGPYSYYE